MRTIKFRYWSNGIRYPDGSGWDTQRGWYIPNHYEYEGLDDPNEIIKDIQERGMIVSQYTGLKDINSKDIYEGDIVVNNKVNCVVEFQWSMWTAVPISTYTDPEYIGVCDFKITLLDKCEIIGNIYENPELLK